MPLQKSQRKENRLERDRAPRRRRGQILAIVPCLKTEISASITIPQKFALLRISWDAVGYNEAYGVLVFIFEKPGAPNGALGLWNLSHSNIRQIAISHSELTGSRT